MKKYLLTSVILFWVCGFSVFSQPITNVGIGSTNPSARLHIGHGTRFGPGDTASIFLQSGNSIGSARDWKVYAQMPDGHLSFRDMGFDNQNNGMTTDAMVIQWGTGNVGIGCTFPAYKLHVMGDIASSGTVRSTNVVAVGAITACSDARYKKNITALTNSLEKLMMMQGVNYFWKTSDFPAMNFNDKMQMGFVAQDVEKIFPEMVFTDDAGYKSVDYSRLTPVLVETIKDQQKQINALFKRVEILEKNNH